MMKYHIFSEYFNQLMYSGKMSDIKCCRFPTYKDDMKNVHKPILPFDKLKCGE